ncbi:MAG: glycosyltransferase [Candidatus Hydrogenedentes bacterium]|nr:glycosyltransferase [Candidatus Hydrogenedentota bacterium]
MNVDRIVFFGKSKARTQQTRFMTAAFRQIGKKVLFLNVSRIRHRLFGRDLTKVLMQRIEAFRPDLVLSFSKDIPIDVLETLSGRVPTALFWPDINPSKELLHRARLVDVFFMTNKGLRDKFIELGIKNPVFCPQAVDEKAHRRVRPLRQYWKSDVAFVGRPHSPFRIEVVKTINDRFDLKVWGGDWNNIGVPSNRRSVGPKEFSKVCNGAKIVVGCDFTTEIECYFSFRTWIVLGCGGFLLTNYMPELETMFRNHEHLVWYKDAAECAELIEYYLAHDDERRRISDQGFEFVHRTRPYRVMAKEMIDTVESVFAEQATVS